MKIELSRYPAYEPTESEWLNETPVGWKAIQLARINTKLTNGFVGPTRDILREGGVRYLQSLHIKGGRIVFDTPYFVSEEWSAEHRKSLLKTGDTLIVQTGDIGQVAAVTDEFAGCNCHALIIVSSKHKMIDGFFLSAVLRSHYGFHSLKSVQTGALHPHLNCTKIRDIYLPIPPLADQRAILTFLDRETAKIDRLSEVRWKQVQRLQEQRAATIHHAVTKGLDPLAKMKPSDIEWLGDIPASWHSIRLGYVASVKARLGWRGLTASEYVESGNIFLSTPDIKGSDIDFDNANFITDERYFESPEIMLQVGDVLLVKDGATLGIVNIVRYLPNRATVNGSIAVIRVKKLLTPNFLFYFLKSQYFQNVIQEVKGGMGVPHLFQSDTASKAV
jgi:type I restriction enzyme, S subunit